VASSRIPRFGEVWLADLDPAVGHEQAGVRPAIVVSSDPFNENFSRLVIVVPVTRTDRGHPFNVPIAPQAEGLRYHSFAMCEMVRSVSSDRFEYRIGKIDQGSMEVILDRLKIIFGIW
jgi:mRNA interferase MazF